MGVYDMAFVHVHRTRRIKNELDPTGHHKPDPFGPNDHPTDLNSQKPKGPYGAPPTMALWARQLRPTGPAQETTYI